MSIAFLLFILWLSLTGLIGLLPYTTRALARLGIEHIPAYSRKSLRWWLATLDDFRTWLVSAA